MRKRGQAAMEFLMTYGWAIIVVLAAIGALAYFGVLNPGNLLPERTTFLSPLPNIDNAVVTGSDDSVQIAMRNNLGGKALIMNVSKADNDCGGVKGDDQFMIKIGTGNYGPLPANVSNGDQFTLSFNCTTNLEANARFSSDITLFYKNLDSGLIRPHAGSVKGKVV